MKRVVILALMMVMVFAVTMQAEANLQLLGQGTSANGTHNLIYDTDFDITWYDYTASVDTWDNQMNWASELSVNFGGNIYEDWRLPTALNQDGSGPCYGYNCTGSEMGHLYYTELGNVNGIPGCTREVDCGLVNTGDFQNLQSVSYYWSGTEVSPSISKFDDAWAFGTQVGFQDYDVWKEYNYSALAVRPGRAEIAVVPEPISSALFLVGSALFGGRTYFRKKRKI